jgi:hypothetical protein
MRASVCGRLRQLDSAGFISSLSLNIFSLTDPQTEAVHHSSTLWPTSARPINARLTPIAISALQFCEPR